GDGAMPNDYVSGNPDLACAKQAKAAPENASKQPHGPPGELSKQGVPEVKYGMEPESLAAQIGQPPIVARDLLRAHRETYRDFWRWSDAVVDHRDADGCAAHRVRLAHSRRRESKSPHAAQLPHAGQRRRDVTVGVLLGDGTRH